MSSIYFLPNLFTTVNLFFGFYSVVAALNGEYGKAAAAIIIAGVFDLFDGRIARATHSYSPFGAEYDSLADVMSFGFAPSILVYLSFLKSYGRIGWLAAFLYLACGALRLARFNVQVKSVEKSYFQGLPIPIAAAAMAGAVLFAEDLSLFSLYPDLSGYIALLLTLALSFLMVSEVKYKSFKEVGLKERRSFGLLVFTVVVMIVVAIEPQIMIFVCAASYVTIGFVTWLISLIRREKSETQEVGAAHPVDQKHLIFFPRKRQSRRRH